MVLSLYGWYHWLHGGSDRDRLPVTRLSQRALGLWILAGAAGTVLWGAAMDRWTDAALPFPDAFTTAMSLIAQWLMARKRLESWCFWIAVDVVAIFVYLAKGLYPTTVLYSVFLVLATLGLLAWDGPTEVGDTPAIREMHEAYLRRVLAGRRIDRFYSSEFYGDHVSRALGAEDRRVDPGRERFPISGTEVRRDPFVHRDPVPPRVYRDLVTNVVLLGAPSTGKSTLAERLARELGTVFMPEYGREYWERHRRDRRLTPGQLVEIAEGHLEREDALLLDANRVLVTDTNAITTCMFALAYHGSALPRLGELAAAAERRYDITFLCDTDIPYDDTWDRSGDADRLVFQRRIVADLTERRVPYLTLRGSVERRAETALAAIPRFTKWTPIRP